MTVNDIVQLVGALGFPIVAYFYMMTRFEKRIDKLDETMDKMVAAITDLRGFVSRWNREHDDGE